MMLLKKTLHLKKKIKSYYNDIVKINALVKDNKELNIKLASLIVKSSIQEKELKLLYENQKNIDNLKNRIIELEKYKEVCTNDIPVMASAITELYNILNVVVSGKLILNRNLEEEIFPISEEISYSDLFENEDDLDSDKKKKKVYH